MGGPLRKGQLYLQNGIEEIKQKKVMRTMVQINATNSICIKL